jgi:hypothetical protein
MADLHPLGFRLRYLASAFGYAVRLHVWQGSRDSQEDPHDHRFAFVAVPLRGRFLERRWRVTDDDGDWTRYDCHSAVRGVRPPLAVLGRGQLTLRWAALRRPLRPYRCALGEIHTYEPVGPGPHVSLVFLGKIRRPASNVWRRNA